MKEKFENEYNRTRIRDRFGKSYNEEDSKFDINQAHKPRIVEVMNAKSQFRKDSYLNMKLRQNMARTCAFNKSIAARRNNNTICLEARG